MVISIICLIFSICIVYKLPNAVKNMNGPSVALLQKSIFRIDSFFSRNTIISKITFATPKACSNKVSIEAIVWKRLIVVSLLSIMYSLCICFNNGRTLQILNLLCCGYITILQITLLLSLLKPLLGVKLDRSSDMLDEKFANSLTIYIQTPRRSLVMAIVNLFEMIISWSIVYRCVLGNLLNSSDMATYFSIVTFTTVGYGDVSAKDVYLGQIAVTLNLIVIVVFSVCHISTILGAMNRSED